MRTVEHIQFNKTECGVDFLLNVLNFKELPRGEILKAHPGDVFTADFFQVVFIQKGKGKLLLDDREIEVQDRSVAFISQKQQYQWRIDLPHFEATMLVFQEDFLNEFFSDAYFTYRLWYFYNSTYPAFLPLSEALFAELEAKLRETKADLLAPVADSAHLIRSLLYYILIKLNREFAREYQISSALSQDQTAFQFRKLVESHVREKQRIEDYTDLLGINRKQLNQAVKDQFNQTATDFIKSRLLHLVKMELLFSGLQIAEIANRYHFSEPNHLSRFFKQQTGLTPTQFKAEHQNGRH